MTLASDARRVFAAAVRSADPRRAVRQNVRRRGRRLYVGGHEFVLDSHATVRVLAIGKAAGAMADAAVAAVGRRAVALAVVPRGYPGAGVGVPTLFGNHPVPGPGSFRAGRRVLGFARAGSERDLVLFLLSGGASAVSEVPADGLTESDLTRTTDVLLHSDAPIGAMNTVRRHISNTKGGRLAVAVGERRFATLALSDVVGDRPEEIGSGPSVPDPTTFHEALSVVRAYRLQSLLPTRVLRHLSEGARGRRPETPKPSWRGFRQAPFLLVGSNRSAVEAAVSEARALGYRTEAIARPIVGETRLAGRRFALALLRESPHSRTRALIAGGETTVTLGRRPGKGGRNQEFALAAASALAGHSALVLSGGTDGIDGPTDATGGWVDGETRALASQRGVDLETALARHATYAALARLGTLLRTGPTGTNVTDVHVGLARSDLNRNTGGSTTRGAVPSSRRKRS